MSKPYVPPTPSSSRPPVPSRPPALPAPPSENSENAKECFGWLDKENRNIDCKQFKFGNQKEILVCKTVESIDNVILDQQLSIEDKKRIFKCLKKVCGSSKIFLKKTKGNIFPFISLFYILNSFVDCNTKECGDLDKLFLYMLKLINADDITYVNSDYFKYNKKLRDIYSNYYLNKYVKKEDRGKFIDFNKDITPDEKLQINDDLMNYFLRTKNVEMFNKFYGKTGFKIDDRTIKFVLDINEKSILDKFKDNNVYINFVLDDDKMKDYKDNSNIYNYYFYIDENRLNDKQLKKLNELKKKYKNK